LEAGKKGPSLRAAAEAAVKLTDEQKKQLEDLRKAMGQLTRESRGKLLEILTNEQRAKLEPH
jgi:Spy/CpxP family protein refolding chaperone